MGPKCVPNYLCMAICMIQSCVGAALNPPLRIRLRLSFSLESHWGGPSAEPLMTPSPQMGTTLSAARRMAAPSCGTPRAEAPRPRSFPASPSGGRPSPAWPGTTPSMWQVYLEDEESPEGFVDRSGLHRPPPSPVGECGVTHQQYIV